LLPDVGVIGAGGRLGQCVCTLAAEAGCAVTLLGRRQGWEVRSAPRVLIDVSHSSALPEVAAWCEREGVALVEGVSGLTAADHETLRRLGDFVPVVRAANFAFGHFVQKALVECLAALASSGDKGSAFSILDRHPSYKKDRPSASACALAEVWEAGAGRRPDTITSVRAGLPVSDHVASLTLAGEKVSVLHSVTDRRAAARGALEAAFWVCRQPAGLYDMNHVYGPDLRKRVESCSRR
jgi:4-hydroxy-tetrahydrodipicolinate reductase